MRLLRLHGTHYEMGLQHGQQLLEVREAVAGAAERRLSAPRDSHAEAAIREVRDLWEVHGRPTIEMLHGIAEGLGMDFDLLLRFAVASYLKDRSIRGTASEGCTVWAASGAATRDGQPILTKNRDFKSDHLALQALALAVPADGYRYAYVTGAGSPGVYSSGMNEEGLAVADTYVPCSDDGPGLPRYSLMMDLLEHHASVASALAYLESVPRMGPGNLVLADANGDSAVFEDGHREWGVVRPADGVVVATNHFVTPALSGCNPRPARPGTEGESESRRSVATALLREVRGRIDGEEARRIMSHHSDGEGAICRHDTGDGGATISNVIFFPAERSLLYCHGRPCDGTYSRHSV